MTETNQSEAMKIVVDWDAIIQELDLQPVEGPEVEKGYTIYEPKGSDADYLLVTFPPDEQAQHRSCIHIPDDSGVDIKLDAEAIYLRTLHTVRFGTIARFQLIILECIDLHELPEVIKGYKSAAPEELCTMSRLLFTILENVTTQDA